MPSSLKDRFSTFSLAEQLLMFGSEVKRVETLRAKGQEEYAQNAADRAFDILFLILNDSRWRWRLRELTRLHEVFADALTGGKAYGATSAQLNDYLLPFAHGARR